MDKKCVKHGDIICALDGTLVKVHHIGERGEVYYLAYANAARGRIGESPYDRYYGMISECYHATETEIAWLDQWINEHVNP